MHYVLTTNLNRLDVIDNFLSITLTQSSHHTCFRTLTYFIKIEKQFIKYKTFYNNC